MRWCKKIVLWNLLIFFDNFMLFLIDQLKREETICFIKKYNNKNSFSKNIHFIIFRETFEMHNLYKNLNVAFQFIASTFQCISKLWLHNKFVWLPLIYYILIYYCHFCVFVHLIAPNFLSLSRLRLQSCRLSLSSLCRLCLSCYLSICGVSFYAVFPFEKKVFSRNFD